MTMIATPPTAAQVPDGSSQTPLRVCHVALTLQTGGLERLLVEFARYHDHDGVEAEFVAMDAVGTPADDIREAGCHVHEMNSTRVGRRQRIADLEKLFRERQFNVIHTHNAYPHLYATIAARRCGIPVVVHTRHGRRFGERFRERLQFAYASRKADRVVAVSDDTADLCRSRGWLGNDKVMRIWNGIDLDRFPYRGATAEPVGISVARLSREKNFPCVMRAVARVYKQRPDFRMKIVGDGAEREMLESMARDLGITDCVEFLGERNDVPDLLATAGFFVLGSFTEGISLTLLEAMAVGLPLVATHVGGNPEIIVPNETGHLVPSDDDEAMATAMVKLLDDPQRRQAMGRAGRDRVEEHFSIRGMVSAYELLYREILEKQPSLFGR